MVESQSIVKSNDLNEKVPLESNALAYCNKEQKSFVTFFLGQSEDPLDPKCETLWSGSLSPLAWMI